MQCTEQQIAVCLYVSLLLTAMCGILFLILGIVEFASPKKFLLDLPEANDNLKVIPYFAVIFGIIIIIAVLFGYYSASKKRVFSILLYATLIFTIIILQWEFTALTANIGRYLSESEMKNRLRTIFVQYPIENMNRVERLQNENNCCGLEGAEICEGNNKFVNKCCTRGGLLKEGCARSSSKKIKKTVNTICIIGGLSTVPEIYSVICSLLYANVLYYKV